MSEWYEAKVTAVAEVGFAELMRDPTCSQYVWFMRGDLIVAPEQPPKMELAITEKLPSHLTKSQLRAWVWERCARVPCLPKES